MISPYGFIYQIRCLVNNKVYNGQTIRPYDVRCKVHFNLLKKGTHFNSHLQSSFNKYGEGAFVTKLLWTAYSKEELDSAEDYFIWRYDSINPDKGYNKKTGGANGIPGKETRMKLHKASLNNTNGRGKGNLGHNLGQIPWNKGKTYSDEYRAKISRGLTGKTLSVEHRTRISEGVRRYQSTKA